MGGPFARLRHVGLVIRPGNLSPRRRLLAALAAVLVLGAGAAALVAGLRAGGAQPSGHPAQDRLGPVLLVPGYGGATTSLAELAASIRAAGRTAIVLHLPGNGTGSLVADAAVLNSAVSQALDQGAPSVDVIGYSAGGVVALIWAREDDGTAKARRVITLGSPFHGTRLAAGAVGFVPGACPVACQQLVPGSSLLASLGVSDGAGLPPWLSVWTTDDQTVVPPDSAWLAGAIDLSVQSLCPAARLTHSQLPSSPIVTAIVLQALRPGPLRYPSALSCVSS
ncbi:MAG TPA: alpha/beta fold hydrolase [Streptosporangiaceae bacterium]|nr:alpha/beta fold hydrolase [Streptosporangiaceae bacterium]